MNDQMTDDLVERLRLPHYIGDNSKARMTEEVSDLVTLLRAERKEAADAILKLQGEVAEARQAHEEHEMGLYAKIQALAPHGTCGCSYDTPNDLCAHHSPQVMRLREALEDIARGTDGHQSYSGTNCAEIARSALQGERT